MTVQQAKVGVFGIGLAAYWPQFEGLKERLEGYQAQVEERLRGMCAEEARLLNLELAVIGQATH
jgi:L-arabinose isomerase